MINFYSILNKNVQNSLTPFEQHLRETENPVGSCVFLLLCWVALADGTLDEEEAKGLNEIANSSNTKGRKSILALAKKNDLDSIQLACELLRSLNDDKVFTIPEK